MSLSHILRETWFKVAGGVFGIVILAVGGWATNWLSANIVFAGDLEPIAESVKELADEISKQREESERQQDEWRCSELDEELQDFYDRQEAGETLTQRELDRMQRIKDRMGEGETGLRCARFED